MEKKKLLIIDDEKDFCKLVKMNLELTGDFRVSTATSGEEGIELAKAIKPDLIFLDIFMPGLDGFESLKRFKSDTDTANIPVIMLTARGDESFKIKAKELCGDAYIMKPVDTSELLAKIKEIFEGKE